MPGNIRVSVLQAFDLPETIGDGEDLVIKVAVGSREFQTEPNKVKGGKTAPWAIDFVFPVLNLRDNLLVMLLTGNGEILSKNEIDTPSIVEKGSFEVSLGLTGGGYIHLSLSFVLTDEERRRIDIMRAAALKRREQEALKTANAQLEQESYKRLSNTQSAEKEDHEENTKEFGLANVSHQAPLLDENELQLNKSVCILQGVDQEPSVGLDPGRDPDQTALETNEKNGIGISYHCIGPQSPVQTTSDQNSSGPNDIHSQCQLEDQTAPESAGQFLEGALEGKNVNPNPSSVKFRMKAFETTRPKGSTKQSHLPANVEVHVSDSKLSSTAMNNMDKEAEQKVLSEEHADHKNVRRTKDKSFAEGNTDSLIALDADTYQKKKGNEQEGKGIERNLESVPNRDHMKVKESKGQREKIPVSASKRRRQNIDLLNVSKQVLTGVAIGAVGGALLIAVGAFPWAPNKRGNTSVRQRRTQERRK